MDEVWAERERRTARLIRVCFNNFLDRRASAQKLHALCKLTWITKSRGQVADNTRSVIAPALAVLTGI
jgi:hypothetical protein